MLGEIRDALLRLQAYDFVLEHATRAVGTNPKRGVVEDARGGARHFATALLVGIDDRASVEAERLELRCALDEVDAVGDGRRIGACLDGIRNGAIEGLLVSLGVGEVGELETRARVR